MMVGRVFGGNRFHYSAMPPLSVSFGRKLSMLSEKMHSVPRNFDRRPESFRLLLVEDNPHHGELIRRRIERTPETKLNFEVVETLSDAFAALNVGGFDAVLLDLVLPDSPIDETLPSVLNAFPEVPVVVLTSLDDLDFATHMVQCGAQDYLVKSQLTGELLARSVRYAVERKKITEANRRYVRELERSNEELKQFAHTVAHEVKNPLNVVSLCLSLLEAQASSEDEEDRETFAEARGAVAGMSELVDELLSFAQVENRQAKVALIDLEAVFDNACSALRSEMSACHATVTRDPLPTIRGDQLQLRHLLQNLIGNSVKYRGPGAPVVHLGVERDGPMWRFAVRDNGIGIPPEHVERVFDMFYRVDADGGPRGTGIGLAFCRRIVEMHGGRIWATSARDGGTELCFTLPVPEPEPETVPEAGAEPAAGHVSGWDRGIALPR